MNEKCAYLRSETGNGQYGCRVKGVCTPSIDCNNCDSHSDPNQRVDRGLINLMRKPSVIGQGYHRSGWPFAMDALRKIHSGSSPLMFDDFVEQTWVYSGRTSPIRQPWAGIFHHPPDPPEWTRTQDRIDRLCLNAAFDESLRELKLAVCLSEYLAEWIADHWGIQTAVVLHPTEVPDLTWQPERWAADKKLLQCGWYLRNTRFIFQIDTTIQRTRLMIDRDVTRIHDRRCSDAMADRVEHRVGEVIDRTFVVPSEYDFLLSRSVVCMEVLDAAANNVTIECLARNTPLIVNRHPAVVEYLGSDYPLYFDHHRDIAEMIADVDLILSGHEYLMARDKSFLDPSVFVDGITKAVESIQ